MHKMTSDEFEEWRKETEEHYWYPRFYYGMKYNQNYKRYHPMHRFDYLWEEFLDLYELPETI